MANLKLIVVHNHFRPGGVRRVIEMATPNLARGLRPRVDEIVLASGEMPDAPWLRRFREALAPRPVACRTDAALLYLAEQRKQAGRLGERIRLFLDGLLAETGPDSLVWAHNQGLGRNLALTRELHEVCGARHIPLVLHHHDWWFDNRWERWAEMRRHGFRTLAQVAAAVFGTSPLERHVAINRADAAVLQRFLGKRAAWVPNPAGDRPPRSAARKRGARDWLAKALNEAAPVWLMPCRLIRRKNIAEALLLTRWLRPEAWLVTTGGPSSAEEETYAARLRRHASENGWRLRLGALHYSTAPKPSVFDLMAASEAVILTSLQEGFGLPYLEAPAAGRPLIARALPNVMPDLSLFGFRFPHTYEEIRVEPSLFDWEAEAERQRRLHSEWLRRLPAACRRLAARPWLLSHTREPAPIPFSRLTLTAQLEVLRAPVTTSWELCARLNPFLMEWRELAGRQALRITAWPRRAGEWLSGSAYLERFRGAIAPRRLERSRDGASLQTQQAFIARTLAMENLYPLTWSSKK